MKLSRKEIKKALQLFVKAGVLIQCTTKTGVITYKNNPEFLKKPKSYQQQVLTKIV